MRKFILALALPVVLGGILQEAFAITNQKGLACTTSNVAMSANSGATDDGNNLVCQSSLWQYPVYVFQSAAASAGSSCSGYATGAVRYNTTVANLEFCNGTNWKTLSGNQSGYGPSPPNTAGYFVLSKTTWDGNLGGPSGADALCVTELGTTNTTWWGYSTANAGGLVNSRQIHAFICDDSACNNLAPSTTYYFANAANVTYGGASFTTDSSGNGPQDSAKWSAANYFHGSYTYWSARATNTSTLWSATDDGNACAGFTDNGGGSTGNAGSSSAADNGRWEALTFACNVTRNLICYVNPCTGLSGLSFTNQTGVTISTLTPSNIILPDYCANQTVSISGLGSPQFQTCSDSACSSVVHAWGTSSQTLVPGQYVEVRLTSSGSYVTGLSATLTIGSDTTTWTVTTQHSPLTVFITSTSYTGSQVGSAATANASCATQATAGSLGGTYKAWLAVTTNTDDPKTTFTHSDGQYKDVSGTKIADNWTALTSGTLAAGISKNESNGSVAANTKVWTNVSTSGTAQNSGSSTTRNCVAWTNNTSGDKGNYGLTGATNSGWTASSNVACNTSNRLYCVQQ